MQQSENQDLNWDNSWEDESQDIPTQTNEDSDWGDWNEDSPQETTPQEIPTNEDGGVNWNEFETDENNSNEDNSWDEWESSNEDENEYDTPNIDPTTSVAENAHLPFISEVEEFNNTFKKLNNYTPTVGDKKDWMFVYNFIKEELEEYKEACEKNDIIGILDALCDITYVSLGNGTMVHGLKTKIWPAYLEVQKSNMSKACKNAKEALTTVKQRTQEQGEECHVEKVGDMYMVYRTRDRKVMKNVYYAEPNLEQFFSDKELKNINDLKFGGHEASIKKEHFLADPIAIENLVHQAKQQDDSVQPTENTDTDEEDIW